MDGIWDTRADTVKNGDNLRDVSPIIEKTIIDANGFTHYFFSKMMFKNPWYKIPLDEFELFKIYIDGGSRSYPSDGNIPCDIVAKEARIILNEIVKLSKDSKGKHFEEAKETLKKGKYNLVRGTLKLYLGKYTTRDWRRKRFTDDIDFWIFKIHVLHHVLRRTGWTRNEKSREWEKKVQWVNPDTNKTTNQVLIAANDLDQLLDFGAGSYLEGTGLKNIFNKKIKRGHDVDLSDLINIAMVKGRDGKYMGDSERKEEWVKAWEAFEEAANTRNSRITSNLISFCRLAMGVAEHLDRVANALIRYNDLIFNKNFIPDSEVARFCRTSIHWVKFLSDNGSDATRKLLHDFYHEQAELKPSHAKNLREFAERVLNLLNSKYKHLKVLFEIQN
jgi:hypothetical protein